MAYMTQEIKKALMPRIKAVLKKYDMKGTVKVIHHSVLQVTLREGAIDFGSKEVEVNTYWIERHWDGIAKKFLTELHEAMNACPEHQNYDNSNIMADYFDVGWYTRISVGEWNKPYILKEIA